MSDEINALRQAHVQADRAAEAADHPACKLANNAAELLKEALEMQRSVESREDSSR